MILPPQVLVSLHCMPPHKKGDRVQAFCGPRLHEAKVLDVDPRNRGRGKPTYRVSTFHYVSLT